MPTLVKLTLLARFVAEFGNGPRCGLFEQCSAVLVRHLESRSLRSGRIRRTLTVETRRLPFVLEDFR